MIERRSTLDTKLIQDARLAQEYLDIAEVLIMALDADHNVTMINQKGAEILGYSKEEIIGKNFINSFLPDRIKQEVTAVGEGIVQKKKEFKKYYENPILTRGGEERLIAWKNTQLRDENGDVIGILTSGEDITDIRKQNQQILQKSRLELMGEMMSMIVHQWRQPLSAISSVTAGMLLKVHLDEFGLEKDAKVNDLYKYLTSEFTKINSYVQNLSHTMDDFRNFYKIDKDMQSVELIDIVASACNILEMVFQKNSIEVLIDCQDHDEREVFYSELVQVLVSILQNSQEILMEKESEDRKIEILIKDGIISISDNGGGIDEKNIYNIFDAYFSTKASKNGTGLGLYISKMIVEEHHKGRLLVENTKDGSCFHIDLKKHS
ncbi:MAG: PAS domain S-box protein [Helicobacteraceae bacterium]|nr:PAS domain S-box protein [Candidatus Sulfurimonas ponti]MBL6973839.1 PAS domain S-box protein [Sulfurimonas sp.]